MDRNTKIYLKEQARFPQILHCQVKQKTFNELKNQQLEQQWNKRIQESKNSDNQVIKKHEQIHFTTLFLIFLCCFIVLFQLVPIQCQDNQVKENDLQ